MLIGLAVLSIVLILILPLVIVFHEALSKGWAGLTAAYDDPGTAESIRLTLTVASIAVPFNVLFGLAAAWLISQFDFKGKRLLEILIDLPIWVSPVVGGLVFLLLFGRQGLFGPWLISHGFQIAYALPGLVLGTVFVTFPYVARNLIPLMESLGRAEEEAALSLGARGWQIFFRITIPKVKWALLYGLVLCNARAMGEFGAVAVLSGNIRGITSTMPLQVENLYNDYHLSSAFALAAVLSLLGLVTLVLKTLIEWRSQHHLTAASSAAADTAEPPAPAK
ncbi:sulfate ABC transporter permease subunit CysW [Verrucomicrobium sp. GAS474]|uniref:sulfate ABC transporter permease subunit CysW n=1 Tax=Verrucomicrobium sp. GAS474 TaxID=1882831 RepID=UPI0031B5AB61